MSTPAANMFGPRNKRIIRSEPNEYDKATIVSIYPKELNEVKHTVFPGKFIIPAGSIEKPSVTVIGPSSWFRDMGEDMPDIEIPNNAAQMANSIVTDYCNGLLLADKGAKPGLFFIPGEWTLLEIKSKYKTAFETAIAQQKLWFTRLLELADLGWAKTNGSPKAISEQMRMAAKELGVMDRDWMSATLMQEMIKCVMCGNLRNPKFPICGHCNRVVDAEMAKKLGLVTESK